MNLTEAESKKFWPVYEGYQKDLDKRNQRLGSLLQSYAQEYRNKSLNDEKAKKLLDEWLTIERDEVKHRRSYATKISQILPAKKLIDEALAIEQAEADLKTAYAPKLNKALPVIKVVRYLQIENKIRALIKYDLAQGVPLVQ